jgi:hypothetical protein
MRNVGRAPELHRYDEPCEHVERAIAHRGPP